MSVQFLIGPSFPNIRYGRPIRYELKFIQALYSNWKCCVVNNFELNSSLWNENNTKIIRFYWLKIVNNFV